MAVESIPERGGALWLENWILGSTVASVSNQDVKFPAKNLLSPHRSATWRSAGAANFARVAFDLGSVRAPSCLALVAANFAGDDSGSVLLRGSDDAAGIANFVDFVFPLYRQDAVGKVLRWYLGDPTSGGPLGSGRQFWSVTAHESSWGPYTVTPGDDFLEVGVVWLGEYEPIIPWEGIRVRVRDSSTRVKAYGGVQWSDPLPSVRELDVPLAGLTIAEFDELEVKIRNQGTTHTLLDLHAFSTDPALKRGGGVYGTFAEDPLDGEFSSPENNTMRLHFEEAAG